MVFAGAEGHPLASFTFPLPEGVMNFVLPSPSEEDKGRWEGEEGKKQSGVKDTIWRDFYSQDLFFFPLFDDVSTCIHDFWPQTVKLNLHNIRSNKIN